MSTPTTPNLDALAEHDGRVGEARAKERALRLDLAQLKVDAERLQRETIAAHSIDDEEAAKRVKAKRARLAARLEDLSERGEGARLAVQRADGERAEFIRTNLPALNAERRPAVEHRVAELRQWAAAGAALADRLVVDAQESARLLAAAGMGTHGVPDVTVRTAIEQVVAAVEAQRAPLPGAQQSGLEALAPSGASANEGQGIGWVGDAA